LKIPGVARAQWRVKFPAMTHLELDARQIPNGQTAPFAAFDDVLGERAFDDGFALDAERAQFSVQSSARRITVEFLNGYAFAQLYAPRDKDSIAIEPMTAPTNALISGKNLRVLNAGETFTATFRIAVETFL
jgi:aldose 1-epimerase